ncbi:MAG: hypothetical protein RL708_2360 [Bacteroidota bacterium]
MGRLINFQKNRMKKYILFVFAILFCINVNAQRIRVTGLLMQKDTDIVKTDVLVNVVGSTEAFFTNDIGRFVMYMNKKDSIKLFVQGYKIFKLSLADSIQKKEYFVKIKLEILEASTQKAVLIRGPKNIKQIEKDIANASQTPPELEAPQIGMTSVISLLYEQFSRRAQQRELLKEQIFNNNRRMVFSELYRFYNYYGLFQLPEKYFDGFTDYHQISLEFLQQNTYYDITVALKAKYKQYAALKGLW